MGRTNEQAQKDAHARSLSPEINGRKESLMLKLKLSLRWIVPLVILALAIAAFVIVPAIGAHAATTTPLTPDVQWGGK